MHFCIMNDNFAKAKSSQKYIRIEVSNENCIDTVIK